MERSGNIRVLTACSAAMLLASCGGGGSTTPADASTSTADSAITDAASEDVAPQAEAAVTVAGEPDAPMCSALGRAACLACCASDQPSAYEVFAREALSCACAPTLCGPLDASAEAGRQSDDGGGDAGDAAAPDADASPFGTGACTANCTESGNAAGECIACIRQTLGPGRSGACTGSVSGCATDPACAPFLACLATCP